MAEAHPSTIEAKAGALTLAKLLKIERIEKRPLKECMKILHSAVFPVAYKSAFFEMIYANNYHGMNLQSLFNGILVGVICARLELDKGAQQVAPSVGGESSSAVGGSMEKFDASGEVEKLSGALEALAIRPHAKNSSASASNDLSFRCYIMTLGVLPQYRGIGIASALLQQSMANLEDFVRLRNEASTQPGKPKEKMRIREIALHVQVDNKAAIAFYTKRGFAIVERITDYYTSIEPKDAYLLTANFPLAHEAAAK
ncbi:N-alpha-acetyltransferase 50-like protein [Perkinsela sp. CCAP 1560/4]|nr:N-alpha-acetyltransferase 50-like protein [Perkinsela sp. CCAP 1560/4]|eukprot:KNH06406.1 N-alpha-acetyltransferase 50-like protein [Perkinsela sp. CCAP 1560/4]